MPPSSRATTCDWLGLLAWWGCGRCEVPDILATHAQYTHRRGPDSDRRNPSRRAVLRADLARYRGTAVSAPPEPAAGVDLEPGTLINQYELIRELGRGGMGVVYAARDRQLGRRGAIKFLRAVTEEVAERFLVQSPSTLRW